MSRWTNPPMLPLVPLALVWFATAAVTLLTTPPLQWIAAGITVAVSTVAAYLWLTTPWPLALVTATVQDATAAEWEVRLHITSVEPLRRARSGLVADLDVSLEAVVVLGQWQDLVATAEAGDTLFLTELHRRWPAARAWRWQEEGRATVVFVRPGTQIE